MSMVAYDQRHTKAAIQLFEVSTRFVDKDETMIVNVELNMRLYFVYSSISDSKSDTSLRCPLRQTLPIFKQPVTYYPTQRDEVKPQVTNTNSSTAATPLSTATTTTTTSTTTTTTTSASAATATTTTTNNTGAGKPSEKTKPRQLFWEKRFQNIRPTDIDGQPFEHFKLPEQIKGNQRD
jgi:hypothetical protein